MLKLKGSQNDILGQSSVKIKNMSSVFFIKNYTWQPCYHYNFKIS